MILCRCWFDPIDCPVKRGVGGSSVGGKGEQADAGAQFLAIDGVVEGEGVERRDGDIGRDRRPITEHAA